MLKEDHGSFLTWERRGCSSFGEFTGIHMKLFSCFSGSSEVNWGLVEPQHPHCVPPGSISWQKNVKAEHVRGGNDCLRSTELKSRQSFSTGASNTCHTPASIHPPGIWHGPGSAIVMRIEGDAAVPLSGSAAEQCHQKHEQYHH